MTHSIPGQTGRQSYQDAHGNWDELIVEAPLVMKAGDWETVNLRTPGHDEDLLRGHLISEALVSDFSIIQSIKAKPNLNKDASEALDEVTATLSQPIKRNVKRSYEMRPSCGLCGAESFSDMHLTQVASTGEKWDSHILKSLQTELSPHQTLFEKTGSCHAAALFNKEGKLLLLREDVGRHNAVDKVIGRALSDQIPFDQSLLMLSGRCGFELIAKAIRVGIGVVVSVSGTTSLSLELAKASGITLVGFCRGDSYRLYHDPGRLT